MTERTKEILKILKTEFPDARCELNYNSVYELLVAVILSAQCTDKRVNEITPLLFERANTPQAMVDLGREEIAAIIRPCGFFKVKSSYLYEMSKILLSEYGGEVPSDFKALEALPGVGRKTANVVTAVGFGQPAIAVDTHVFRVSNRLGLACSDSALGTEFQLRESIDRELWSETHHLILLHGRYVCKAIKPKCGECPLNELCEKRLV